MLKFIIPAFGKPRQESYPEFQGSLSYILWPHIKTIIKLILNVVNDAK